MNSLFDVVEQLSRSRKIRDGKLEDAISEIITSASKAIKTNRVNAWLFVNNFSEIKCIGNYDFLKPDLALAPNLPKQLIPNYFNLLTSKEIVITTEAFENPQASELLEIYLKPFDVHSLMDIPIYIAGELVGLVCFENTKTSRVWTDQEQKFGLVIAQIISLAIETDAKQRTMIELEKSLVEQKVLLQEVHHRVKNNLTIISSLLNLQANKSKDDYHKKLFYESRDRLNSIATVHQLLYQSKSFSSVNFKKYLEEVLSSLDNSFSGQNKKIIIKKDINDVELDVSTSIPLALIVNEFVTNSYKHAFNGKKEGVIEVSLTENNKKVFVRIKDSGPGYDFNNISESSIGLDIIHGLVDQINATLTYDNQSGSTHDISFTKS